MLGFLVLAPGAQQKLKSASPRAPCLSLKVGRSHRAMPMGRHGVGHQTGHPLGWGVWRDHRGERCNDLQVGILASRHCPANHLGLADDTQSEGLRSDAVAADAEARVGHLVADIGRCDLAGERWERQV